VYDCRRLERDSAQDICPAPAATATAAAAAAATATVVRFVCAAPTASVAESSRSVTSARVHDGRIIMLAKCDSTTKRTDD